MDEKKEPTLLQQRKKDLFFSPTNGYDRLAPGEEEDIQAYCAGYDTVTVIHGRGEGILRREVQELCKRVPYIAEHNLGGPGEGGYGVTIVKFRR